MIQRTGRHTSTKNLQEYLQLQHRFYPSSPQSVFIHSPQSLFSTYFLFYTQSIFSSFIPSPYFISSPQSLVRSPCFILTKIQPYLVSKDAIFFLFSRRNIELKTSKHKCTDRSHQNKRDIEGGKLSGSNFTSFQQNVTRLWPTCRIAFTVFLPRFSSLFGLLSSRILQNNLLDLYLVQIRRYKLSFFAKAVTVGPTGPTFF